MKSSLAILVSLLFGLSHAVAANSETMTLFIVGETSGQFAILAKNGEPLVEPKFESDKTSDPQMIQVSGLEEKKPKFFLVTNTGTQEVPMFLIGNSMVFITVSNAMHSTLTVCLDRRYSDGTFLTVETMVRPDAFNMGATLARVFHGRARPSPILDAVLKQTKQGKK